MPSSYLWQETVVITPARLAYALMRLPDVQHLARSSQDPQIRDALIAMRRAAQEFERGCATTGTDQAAQGEQRPGSEDWVSASTAASRLGLKSSRAIRMAIERGKLPGTQGEGGRWRIKLADLELYRKDRWHGRN